MVDTGIVQKLLELLNHHVEEGNVTVQHAALSALRNLAIPGESPYLINSDKQHQELWHLKAYFSNGAGQPAMSLTEMTQYQVVLELL